MNKKRISWIGLLLSLLFLLLLAGGWELGARWYDKRFIIPTPTDVALKLWDLQQVLITVHLPATLWVILLGLAISIVLGVLVATFMSMSRLIDQTLYPLLIGSQTIPIIALAPIFMVIFGYTTTSKLVVTVLITFFPITVSTLDGLRSASREYRDLLRTMGASSRQIFTKVQVPAALPYFFSGMKVAVTLSVIGAAIAEWLGSPAGLGYFSRRMMQQYDAAAVFAPIVVLSLVGIGLFVCVVCIEKIALRWRRNQ
jgi:putative hydroxymethylpyrimidine transport system permease protein